MWRENFDKNICTETYGGHIFKCLGTFPKTRPNFAVVQCRRIFSNILTLKIIFDALNLGAQLHGPIKIRYLDRVQIP